MSYTDIHAITLIIRRYVDRFKTKFDMPFLKYIINPNIENLNDDFIALHSCYEYYRNIIENFEKVNELDKLNENISKKNFQIKMIKQIITKSINLDGKTIHEICCGFSILGEELIKDTFNTQLFGYDINKDLLKKNTIDFEKKNIKNVNFVNMNLLTDKIIFKNDFNEVITCLHGCGQLHRNIIDMMIEQKYNGAFYIIPCCYYRFTQNYKLYNIDFVIPHDLLESVSLCNNSSDTLSHDHKHIKQMLFNIRLNIFVKYLIINNIIGDNYNVVKIIKEYGYFTLKKINVNLSEKIIWNKFFTEIFEDGKIKYDDYKDRIDEQIKEAHKILDKILFEKYNILQKLSKLIEWLINIDYLIHLQSLMPYHHISISQFISAENTPRNLIISGKISKHM
jgi:hypothetical protein